jgi:hypothetical protein
MHYNWGGDPPDSTLIYIRTAQAGAERYEIVIGMPVKLVNWLCKGQHILQGLFHAIKNGIWLISLHHFSAAGCLQYFFATEIDISFLVFASSAIFGAAV